MKNGVFIENYKKQMLSNLKLIYKNKSEEELMNVINSEVDKWEKENKDKEISKEYEVGWMDIDESVSPCEIGEILEYLETSNKIIAGSGSLYNQHNSDIDNILAGMVDMLLKTRKIYKKEKFKAKEAGDAEKTLFNDLMQLTYKILANSFYGASNEKNCIFFDNFFGISITLTSRIIITTAIYAFESFSGNFYFKNTEDFLLYINNIVNEERKEEFDIPNMDFVPKEKLINLLVSKFEDNPYDLNMIRKVVNNLSDYEVKRIYYKNNYLEFMKIDFMKEKYSKIAGHIFMNPNDPQDLKNKDKHEPYIEFENNLNEIWDYLSEWVLYKHLNIHRYEFALTHNRKTVLVIN